MNIVHPSIELIYPPKYEDMLKKIEIAGRVCYKSENKITDDSAENFIKMGLTNGHMSFIEHCSITVKVICDRGVSHEIVRHRIASYSQESTRYCNYADGKFRSAITVIDFTTGFNYDLRKPNDRLKYKEWIHAMDDAEAHYMKLLELGATPQEARAVLPNSLKTEIVMTMDIPEWRHFLKLRTASSSHPQMIEVASMILNKFVEEYPIFFKDLVENKD